MNVLVALEYHFLQGPKGILYADNHYHYEFWKRYLTVFDHVLILARATQTSRVHSGWRQTDGPHVSTIVLPDFRGPWNYVRMRRETYARVQNAISQADSFILRVPGTVGFMVEAILRKEHCPFAIEVVGDPWDSFAPGGVKSIARPFARRVFAHDLRRLCGNAVAAAYVTAEQLQNRYPPGPHTFTTHYSSVELPREAIVEKPRDYLNHKEGETHSDDNCELLPWKLLFIGSFEQLYKGPDILLRALQIVQDSGINVRLTMLGDGKYRGELELLTEQLKLTHWVEFRGKIPSGPPVWKMPRESDLFILPSRTEGLPRALIEAMAAGLPCIGSRVGGIPELLPPQDMVTPDDPVALAEKITSVCTDRKRMSIMSQRNLQVAQDYRADILEKRRTEFYQVVKDRSRGGMAHSRR